MSIATVGNIGDSNAGVLAAAGGLTNRTYRFRTGRQERLDVHRRRRQPGARGQRRRRLHRRPLPVRRAVPDPGPGLLHAAEAERPGRGARIAQNADPASMPTCFYDSNDAVQDRTHLAMVSYSQTVHHQARAVSTLHDASAADRLRCRAVEPSAQPDLRARTTSVSGRSTSSAATCGSAASGRRISVPTGPDVPKDRPDLQTYAAVRRISKLAVFPAANPLPATTTTVTSSQNPTTVGDPVTFTATVAPTSVTGTPTGTVQFSVDGTPVGTEQTLVGGTASYATVRPGRRVARRQRGVQRGRELRGQRGQPVRRSDGERQARPDRSAEPFHR